MTASFFEVPTMSQALAMHSQNHCTIPEKEGFLSYVAVMEIEAQRREVTDLRSHSL